MLTFAASHRGCSSRAGLGDRSSTLPAARGECDASTGAQASFLEPLVEAEPGIEHVLGQP